MAYIRRFREKWQAQIDRNGQRKSKTFDTKREAQAWAMEQEAKAKRERHGGNHTLGDALDKYKLEVASKKDGAPWEYRRLHAFGESKELGGRDAILAEIDAPQLAAWRDARIKEVSGSTVVRDFNLLRNLFNVARLEWKWIEHKPFEGLKIPKENPARTATWPWQLIKRVLRAERSGKTAEMQLAFHIALRTGMRMGEVLASPGGLDERGKVVVLNDVVGARKTEKVYRIPVGKKAIKLIKGATFTVGANEGSVLFSKLCRELLIEGLTFHDTRASALTWMAKRMPVEMLAKVSRHRDISLLVRVYYRPKLAEISDLL
jgi:integrase